MLSNIRMRWANKKTKKNKKRPYVVQGGAVGRERQRERAGGETEGRERERERVR